MIALTSTQLGDGKVEICCCCCYRSLGTISYDLLLRALMTHGDILCPECRQRHCEFCGWVETAKYNPALGTIRVGEKEHRICTLCKGLGVKGDVMPRASRHVSNIRPRASVV